MRLCAPCNLPPLTCSSRWRQAAAAAASGVLSICCSLAAGLHLPTGQASCHPIITCIACRTPSTPHPQYGSTSGLLEYTLQPAAGGDGAAQPPGLALPLPVQLSARLPFMQQDVQQGSGSLRPGDHVTFRIATNLQASDCFCHSWGRCCPHRLCSCCSTGRCCPLLVLPAVSSSTTAAELLGGRAAQPRGTGALVEHPFQRHASPQRHACASPHLPPLFEPSLRRLPRPPHWPPCRAPLSTPASVRWRLPWFATRAWWRRCKGLRLQRVGCRARQVHIDVRLGIMPAS